MGLIDDQHLAGLQVVPKQAAVALPSTSHLAPLVTSKACTKVFMQGNVGDTKSDDGWDTDGEGGARAK